MKLKFHQSIDFYFNFQQSIKFLSNDTEHSLEQNLLVQQQQVNIKRRWKISITKINSFIFKRL